MLGWLGQRARPTTFEEAAISALEWPAWRSGGRFLVGWAACKLQSEWTAAPNLCAPMRRRGTTRHTP